MRLLQKLLVLKIQSQTFLMLHCGRQMTSINYIKVQQKSEDVAYNKSFRAHKIR